MNIEEAARALARGESPFRACKARIGTTGRRCQVVGAGEDVNDSLHGDWVDAYVDVQCSLPDGTWADAPVVIYRWDRS